MIQLAKRDGSPTVTPETLDCLARTHDNHSHRDRSLFRRWHTDVRSLPLSRRTHRRPAAQQSHDSSHLRRRKPGDRASLGLSRLGDLGRSAKCGGVHRGPAHLPRPRITGGDAQLSGRLSGGLQQGTALAQLSSEPNRSRPTGVAFRCRRATAVDSCPWRTSFPETISFSCTATASAIRIASPRPRPVRHATARWPTTTHKKKDETTARTLTWTIQELSNARSLANEGKAMGHCLSATAVKLSETSIWLVQVVDGDRVKRILTVAWTSSRGW